MSRIEWLAKREESLGFKASGSIKLPFFSHRNNQEFESKPV
jgi:hypothetical protein